MNINWKAIESEFRAGTKSLREIARDHGISDTAIRKKSKSGGWVRKPEPANHIEKQGEHKIGSRPSLHRKPPPQAPMDEAKGETERFDEGDRAIFPPSRAAQMFGITRKTLYVWMDEGMPYREDGTGRVIDVEESLPWVRDKKWTAADDLARLRRIQADDAQLDLDVKLGTLMKASDAVRAWEASCASMRARILSVPPVAQQRLGLDTPRSGTLRDLLHEALEVLSGRMETPEEDEDEPRDDSKVPLPAGQKRRGRKPKP